MQQKNSNLTASGYINDTRPSQSIIRPDLVEKVIKPLYGVSLRTATGEAATVHGKVNANSSCKSV
ncbi:hypothetical protein CVS40_5172 [Lucilia cuprina]|nr:hypothetical protein CVS40_5172 [Lucilia cuprina]